jgi:hypothetical protein
VKRVLLLLLALALVGRLFAADQTRAEKRKRPVSAEIVVAGDGGQYPEPIGNVRVKYSDGTTDLWTTKGDCSLPRVSPTGMVGWTVNDPATPYIGTRTMRLNNLLVLVRAGKVIGKITGTKTSIEDWGFLEDPSRVVLCSRWPHGPADCELHEIKTGALIQSVKENATDLPDWAKPFAFKVR